MNAPLRRGACPGLSAPMQTGDGLLVRLRPIDTISLSAFGNLCAAAREYGNGIIEVTARGSIQIRGLRAASAPRFAAAVTLGIAADDGVPVHVNPLAGLDPGEILDAATLAADLRRALAQQNLAARLAPKVSVVIDGGGAVVLDDLSADVRLCARSINGAAVFRVSVAGDEESATRLGCVSAGDGVKAAMRLLEVIAPHGRAARARDVVVGGIAPFQIALADLLLRSPEPDSRLRRNERKSVIGVHAQRDKSFACGVGLAFGHTDAQSLAQLIDAAAAAGAVGMRTAPGRSLLILGLSDEAARTFAAEADRLGFIIRSDDPRRFLIACAGAPVCASAHIATRAMAPHIATNITQYLRRPFEIHLSGCAKGCAHPASAVLTIVGLPEGCGLIANGVARQAPFATVAKDEAAVAIARYARALIGEGGHV